MWDTAGLAVLEPAESFALLRTTSVGRVVFTEDALPAVQPVIFTLHDGSVVIRTSAGANLTTATNGAVVAFQTDAIDAASRAGWSVTVVGHAAQVTDPAEIAELDALDLLTWSAGGLSDYIRIRIQRVTGRRLAGPTPDELSAATAGRPG